MGVFHFGARLHYAVAVLMNRAGILESLFTDAYSGAGSSLRPLFALMPKAWLRGPLKRLAQRKADLPGRAVIAFNRLGVSYVRAYSRATPENPAPKVFLEYNRRFARAVVQHPRFKKMDALYGFCGASRLVFEEAKKEGKRCILEQMIAPVAEMKAQVQAQEKRWPGWAAAAADDWDTGIWTPLEEAEWQLSDLVLAPSDYVRDCLLRAGVSDDKIRVVPYGVRLPDKATAKRAPVGRPLRVLYAGAVDLRKGAPSLITAGSGFGPDEVEVRMAGRIGLRQEKTQNLPPTVRLLGQVSRSDMSGLYEWADVFVLPSVCEGSATVCYEALARGVPVIATYNTGAPHRHGEAGLILRGNGPEDLAGALRSVLCNPSMIEKLSLGALALRPFLSWEGYGERLLASMGSMASGHEARESHE